MNTTLTLLLWPIRTILHIFMQPDKIAHFYWGGCLGLSGLWMGWWALAIVAALAACKELYDLFHPPHQCELWDFIATVLGGACAIGVIHLHHHFSSTYFAS